MTERADSMWMRVIDKYYSDNPPLRDLLILHSRLVADKALKVAGAHPELGLDVQFVEEAAMLHDIGIFLTDAAPIHCFGKYHYLCHGYLGADLLREEGLPRHALVAERHTGTGLTLKQILERDLPVPHRDMTPVSIEEKVVCFADKFYSKTRPNEEKSVEQAEHSLSKFGQEGVLVFREWCNMFL
ncbi:MAG: HDIG domain-containing protein [Bacteroidaceae bacterium]|nr:HDIG domain-containing protein [Bacteroidaceae bacterium]